ncbi:MAG: galactose oxidase-like domain-containing protein [Candidatus Polarisedimenticolia bacterium]
MRRSILSILAVILIGAVCLPGMAGERVQKDAEADAPRVPLTAGMVQNTVGNSLEQLGSWTAPAPWPVIAVHMVLLHTGRVMFWRGDEDVPVTYLWDPATEQIEPVDAGIDILFCVGQIPLEDGRVLAVGGEVTQNTGLGPPLAHIFDPLTLAWSRTADMQRGRYYPTSLMQGDGSVLAFSGTDEVGVTNNLVETFTPGSSGGADTWTVMSGATKTMTYYPRMHLLASGKVLHTGPERTTEYLEPLSHNWTALPPSNYGKRTQGTSVMLPPGNNKFMILGGRDRGQADPLATATAEILDVDAPEPEWRFTTPMGERRMNLNTVILPDATVLVAGGTSDENITPALTAQIFDPATETWKVVAPMATHRGYHSTALLLPDGRVLWAGANGNYTAEVYSPPYLFRGPRPTISFAPSSAQYGQPFIVMTPEAPSIAKVVLMRAGSPTHAFDVAQRYVPLSFTAGAGSLDVVTPNEPNIAPPGYYMLFLVDGAGIPSVASFVHLSGTAQGNRPPIVDAGPNQTILHPQAANLNGTIADDGLPLPQPPSTQWSTDSGPGTVSFANASAVDTTATFSGPGIYVLRLTATDSELNASDTVTVTVNVVGETGYPVESRVSAASDDAEEVVADSDVTLGSTDLELVNDGVDQKVGLRFNNLPIPPSETIVRAWVQFKADETQTDPTNLVIRGQASDNAPTFTGNTGNVSSRPLTAASVVWAPPAWNAVGQFGVAQRTPMLTSIIQEIVNRPGWAKGNSIVLIISGTGHRTAEAFEGDQSGAPILHVELANEPVNSAPTVDAGTGVTVRIPESLSLDGNVQDDGLPFPPGTMTTLWVQESGPGVATFANPYAVDTTVTFSAPGRYEMALNADDSEFVVDDHLVIEVLEPLPGGIMLQSSVGAGTDDAEEAASTGAVTLTSGDLELVDDGGILQVVGLRFAGVNLGPTTTVHRAWIQFQSKEAQSVPTSLTIEGIAQAQAPTFSAAAHNISSRPRTSASAVWSPAPWTVVSEAGINQQTTDLTAIVQELLALPGRAAGDPMAFVFTGTGHRTARSYENDPLKVARLFIEYTD